MKQLTVRASTPVANNGHKRGTTVLIPLGELRVDPAAQRQLVPSHVARIAADFDPSLVGVIYVSKRKDGYYIVDGQHRVAAMRAAGYDKTALVEAIVFQEIDRAAEAVRFNGLNTTKQVQAIDRFRVRVTAGDPVAVAIDGILSNAGLRVSGNPSPGAFAAVLAAEKVYTGAVVKSAEPTPWAFEETIKTLREAWGVERDAYGASIIEGLGAFLIRYKDADRQKLARCLAKLDGGALRLIHRSKIRREVSGGTLWRSVAMTIVDVYNSGRRTTALPPWDDRR